MLDGERLHVHVRAVLRMAATSGGPRGAALPPWPHSSTRFISTSRCICMCSSHLVEVAYRRPPG
jgi:hypothetical protein